MIGLPSASKGGVAVRPLVSTWLGSESYTRFMSCARSRSCTHSSSSTVTSWPLSATTCALVVNPARRTAQDTCLHILERVNPVPAARRPEDVGVLVGVLGVPW